MSKKNLPVEIVCTDIDEDGPAKLSSTAVIDLPCK